jgi:hypothetical protein
MNLAHVIAKFTLDGDTYEVEQFNVRFHQPTDFKGQPQHEIMGGQLILVLPQAADNVLYDWAKRSSKLKSGEIAFETEMSSPVLKVLFTNAYCVKLTREIDAYAGTKTTLVIAPETVDVNGINHENHWKK